MKRERIESVGRYFLIMAGVACLCLVGAAAGQGDPAGQTRYVGCGRVNVQLFESESPIRSEEEPGEARAFDQSLLPSGFQTKHVERRGYKHLKIVRPYDRASFPANIAAPKFRWEDLVNNVWMLELKATGWSAPLRVVTDRRQWRPDAATWNAIKQSGTGGWVDLEVRGCVIGGAERVGGDVYVDSIRFRVSQYPADPVIVYRLVSPLFHGFKTPDVDYRDISAFETHTFLPSKGSHCSNCHVFPRNPPVEKNLDVAIAVRGSFGRKRLLGLYRAPTGEGEPLLINSFFMGWDPEGRRVAVTGGDRVVVKNPISLQTQEFHVFRADILIVDAKTRKASALPGASDPDYAEGFPTWSPDGRTIIFARTKEIEMGEKRGFPRVRYDLYKIPYNDGEGGTATPIEGASNNGKSNFSPRFSPDGKWLVFTQADEASLVEPSADLWIVSTKEGAVLRKLECNVDHAMDSHHSWSSNSRWLLFASKRDDGIFARVYLTEIDDEGYASPPVELPILGNPMMCFNVPEFSRYTGEFDSEDLFEKVSFREQVAETQ